MNIDRLKKFIDEINELNNKNDIIKKFLDTGCSVLDCEGGTFFSADEKRKMLKFEIVLGDKKQELEGISFPYTGIVGWCVENKRSVLVRDTSQNPLFTKKIDYAIEYKTRSIISIFLGMNERIYGVVEFINPRNKENFTEDDFTLIYCMGYFVLYRLEILHK